MCASGPPESWDCRASRLARYCGRVASDWKRQRCRERVEALAGSSADIDVLRREAIEILQATIGFDRWCSLLLDPDTLVISHGIGHNDWTLRAPAPQPARGRPERRQQPRNARAQPPSRRRPERGDGRRSRPCGPLAQRLVALRRGRRARMRRHRRARELGRLPLLPQQRRRALLGRGRAADAQPLLRAGTSAATARGDSHRRPGRRPGRDGRAVAGRAAAPMRRDERRPRLAARAEPSRHPVPRRHSRSRLECRRQADGDRARRGSRAAGARARTLCTRRLGDRRGGATRRRCSAAWR